LRAAHSALPLEQPDSNTTPLSDKPTHRRPAARICLLSVFTITLSSPNFLTSSPTAY